MTGPDPRITLARQDLASSTLEGVVKAARFVEPVSMRVVQPSASIRKAPTARSEQVDQLLFGEVFDRLDSVDGHASGQARRDGYVGWVEEACLSAELATPTHRVSAIRTFAFGEPSIKSAFSGPLSLNALLTVIEERENLVLGADIGWITRSHLAPVGVFEDDPADVAERYLGAPYLWGGRDSLGLDCSGLIQQALYACGCACPRDTDMQAALGRATGPGDLRRNDLVFWRGHVGMMLDSDRLIHANGHHMAVVIEPLAQAIERIKTAGGGPPTAFRRP